MAYSTGTSRVVPHHSTIPAARGLTSRFGWDVVHSASYGRRRKIVMFKGTCSNDLQLCVCVCVDMLRAVSGHCSATCIEVNLADTTHE